MKILQIIPSFGMGGAEKVVLNYLRIAKKKGLEFVAISLYQPTGSIYDRLIEKEGLNVIYLNKKKGFDIGIVSELRKAIKMIKPDTVHTHLYSAKYYLLTGIWNNYRNFHTIHSTPAADARGIDYWANRFLFFFGKATPIVLHERLVEEAKKYYKVQKAVIIGNGIFLDDYRCKTKNAELALSLGIFEGDYVIGNIGSFKKPKNHGFMIDLLYEIIKERQKVKLLFIGDGELLDKTRAYACEKGVEEYVIFAGNREDIPQLLGLMDVFLFPSLYEGLGLALIEAQIAGVRCVASDTVPQATCVSNGVEYISLQNPIEIWKRKVLEDKYAIHLNEKINTFNIENVLDGLLEIYGKQ